MVPPLNYRVVDESRESTSKPQGTNFLYGQGHITSRLLLTPAAQLYTRPAHNRHKKAETSKTLDWPLWPVIFDDPPDDSWPFRHQGRAHAAQTLAPLHAGRAAGTSDRQHHGRAHAADTSFRLHAERAVATKACMTFAAKTTHTSIDLEVGEDPGEIVASKSPLTPFPSLFQFQEFKAITVNLTPSVQYMAGPDSPSFDTRDLAVWINSEGRAIYDGDVLAGPFWQLETPLKLSRDEINLMQDYFFNPRRVYTRPSSEGHFQYKYDTEATKDAHAKGVNDAIQDWVKHAPYLKFSEIPPSAEVMSGVITITSVAQIPNYSSKGS
ncbi:hypothetical protein B0J14DRAFT_569076 [Halenospora varia]|nr:hypothetical protein B0J14DRAFT_569076 [Halenospora varia]